MDSINNSPIQDYTSKIHLFPHKNNNKITNNNAQIMNNQLKISDNELNKSFIENLNSIAPEEMSEKEFYDKYCKQRIEFFLE